MAAIFTKVSFSKTDGNNGQEHARLKHIPCSTPLTMGERLEQNSQMELVGHSIVRSPPPNQATSGFTQIVVSTLCYCRKYKWIRLSLVWARR